MTKQELQAFLTLLMCSDPWSIPGKEYEKIIEKFADDESKRHGFSDWITAYHEL
jgi:hypothetical protein